MKRNDVVIGFRVSAELDQRIQKLQERLQERLSGMGLSRSQFIRNLLERGADALERELSKELG
jgi:predicted DNA-binding protein